MSEPCRGHGMKSAVAREAGASPPSRGNVVFIASHELGTGDPELGPVLMRMFILTLKESDPLPAAMIFVNSGVRLTTAGSLLLGDLRDLEARGVEVLSCGTCLDFYQLKDELQAGTVTTMRRIVGLLSCAERVIRP